VVFHSGMDDGDMEFVEFVYVEGDIDDIDIEEFGDISVKFGDTVGTKNSARGKEDEF